MECAGADPYCAAPSAARSRRGLKARSRLVASLSLQSIQKAQRSAPISARHASPPLDARASPAARRQALRRMLGAPVALVEVSLAGAALQARALTPRGTALSHSRVSAPSSLAAPTRGTALSYSYACVAACPPRAIPEARSRSA